MGENSSTYDDISQKIPSDYNFCGFCGISSELNQEVNLIYLSFHL